MMFHWNLSDSKSPHVSRTLLSILANLNNFVVWMVWIFPPISNSSSLFPGPWELFYVHQSGGARGVMIIVIGNGHGDTSSNPGQD